MENIMGKRFLISILVLSCIASLTACGKLINEESMFSKEQSQFTEQELTVLQEAFQASEKEPYILPETLENANLVIVWDTTEEAWKAKLEGDPNAFNLVWSTKEAFEQKYGGHVEVIGVNWGDMMNQTISMVNAGEVCDLVQAHDQNFPIYATKNIVQDVSKYINIEDDFWYDSVTKAFTYGGVPYAIGADANPVVISYNKTLFEQNNVKTPREYFDEGNWTWDTFRDVALKLTKDTDGDGITDIYGFGWWSSFYVQMLNANGTTSLMYGEDGTIESNFLRAEARETFQFLQDGYVTEQFIKYPEGDSFINDFKNGTLAMTCEYGFAAKTNYECDYEIEWAPLPIGPSGEKYDCGGSVTGFAVPVTSKNPEGAAAFARMAYEMLLDYNKRERVEKYGLQEVDLMSALAQNIHFSTIGVDKYWDAEWTIFQGLIEGTPINMFATTADGLIKEGAAITLEKK